MFKNYLVTTFRTIRKYKGFSIINVLGLALSMSVCLVIILFVREELSFDRFHNNKERIYRVNSTIKFRSGVSDDMAASPAPLASVLRTDYASVENAATLRRLQTIAVGNERGIAIRGLFAEPSFFEIFDFGLGTVASGQSLSEPYTMVIGEETAEKFFGAADAVGKTLALDNVGDVLITGILEKPAGKSHFDPHPDALVSFSTLQALAQKGEPHYLDDWQRSAGHYYTYLLFRQGSGPGELEQAFPQILKEFLPEADSGPAAFFLQALTDIRLGPPLSNKIERQTPVEFLYVLGVLAVILTLTASFNYVNLSVARSLKRAREVGIRKIAGAFRRQIAAQFMGEAIIVAWIALAFAILLLEMVFVPAFNNLWLARSYLDSSLSFQLSGDPSALLLFFAFATLVGLFAGAYPAVIFSSYLPSVVLKGASTIRGFFGTRLRKSLIVTQFALSMFFIVTALVLYRQSQYLLGADYGFYKEQVVNVALQNVPYDILRAELLRDSRIENVSAVSMIPGIGDRERQFFHSDRLADSTLVAYLSVDANFVANLDIPIIAGRDFSRELDAPGEAILLNQAAVAQLRLGTADESIGRIVTASPNRQLRVVGVLEDFYFMSLGNTGPLALLYDQSRVKYANVRIAGGDVLGAVAHLERTWKQLDPQHPVEYQFFDQQIAAMFKDLVDYVKLISVGAAFVVFIACLGLLGMATYNAESRVKEVGIRKVLGASVASIVVLLSRDFLKLIAISALVAWPLAWYLNDLLLQDFSYRVTVGVGVFVIGIVATMLLAFLTIASQAVRAAMADPVETLRYE